MTLRSTASLSVSSSCSQILIVVHPIARSTRTTFLSRSLFPFIFAIQNAWLVTGMERQRRHPCQKQPSTKMASCLCGKTTSGLPGRPESCPMIQPLIPDRISRDRNFHSVVFVPRDLLRLITRERVARSNLSKALVPSPQRKMTMQMREDQDAPNPIWRLTKPSASGPSHDV